MRRQAGAAEEEQQQAQLLASLLDQLRGSGAAVAVVAAAGQRLHVSGVLLRPGRLGVEVVSLFSLSATPATHRAAQHVTNAVLTARTGAFTAALSAPPAHSPSLGNCKTHGRRCTHVLTTPVRHTGSSPHSSMRINCFAACTE